MRTFLLVLSIVILSGCTSVKVKNTLKDVESYISERPDSALSVLESIERADLKGRRSEAHHALLHAMALDKNYIDVTDDSLASVAVNYYQKHGSKKYLAKALYYKGLSYYYDGKHDKAIVELSKAEPIAQIYDSLYLGFVKVLQANIYNNNYNTFEEVVALEKALEVYTSLKADYYIDVAKHRLSQAYMAEDRHDEAELLLNDLLMSGRLNERMNAQVMGDYAFLMGTRPDADYKKAVDYFEKTAQVDAGRYLSKQDYWVWAYALAETGDFDRSQQIIDMLSPMDSSGTAYYWQYAIARNQGMLLDALDLFEKFSDRNNEEVVQILKQSISSVQRDYYRSQYAIADYKARNRSLLLVSISVSTLFLLTLVCLFAFKHIRKKEEEKNHYIRYAEEVNRQLDEFRNGAYSGLQKKYISMHKAKYETLQILFERYLQSDGRADAEKLVYKKVVSLINELKKDIENTSRFDKTLDSELNGMMTNLRAEFPRLNQRYYVLFGYLALGFKSPIIAHFMGCSENAVRIIKNRLKSTIKNSDAEHKDDFLEVIG